MVVYDTTSVNPFMVGTCFIPAKASCCSPLAFQELNLGESSLAHRTLRYEPKRQEEIHLK